LSNLTKLVAFSKEQPARLLTNYLIDQGIKVHYQRSDAEYSHGIMLLEADKYQQAKKIAEEFVLHPNNDKYQSSAWQTGESVSLDQDKSFSIAKIYQDLFQAPFTAIILVFCVVAFGLAQLGIYFPYLWLEIQPLSQLTDNHQWWRIWGPALIHGSVLHIAFNLLWWWSLGKQIEKTFGFSTLLLLFVFSAGISNLAQLIVSGPNFGGLSGVVYALVGCVWWLGWLRPTWGIGMPNPIIGFMLVWLLVGYLDVLPISMANMAHTLGLVSGCLFAGLLVMLSKKPQANQS
jgi:GlpG protein